MYLGNDEFTMVTVGLTLSGSYIVMKLCCCINKRACEWDHKGLGPERA